MNYKSNVCGKRICNPSKMNFPHTVTWKINYADDFMLFLLNFQWIIHFALGCTGEWCCHIHTYSMHINSFCLDAPSLPARLHNSFWMLMKQMQSVNIWRNDPSLSLSPCITHVAGLVFSLLLFEYILYYLQIVISYWFQITWQFFFHCITHFR